MKRVAIYVRVSTQDQSTELQQRELEDYCRKRGWVVVGLFEDKVSGTKSKRPLLTKLLEGAQLRRFDIVLCWKLDRFFRSLKDLVRVLSDLNDVGVEFVSLKDNLDLTTSSGRLMLHIIGAFAEFEASLIRERVRAGLNNARAKGVLLGRPRTVDGESVALLRASGLSIRSIGRKLGVSPTSVHKSLQRMGPGRMPKSLKLKAAQL